MIKYDFTSYMKEINFTNYENKIKEIKKNLESTKDLTEWYDLNKCVSKEILDDLKETSTKIKENCDVFIVIGAGGSVLGAKGVLDAFKPYFKRNCPEIIFLGTSLSATYLSELLIYLKNKDVIINVISKSGSTLETNLYFNYLYEELEKKYNQVELQKRIIITTDIKDGKLRDLVNKKGYKSFVIPKKIGGRYSTLTAVGLLPIAVAGIDLDELLQGARELDKEKAFDYAIIRDVLYKKGKKVESLTIYEPKLLSFLEIIKQLLAETQGKSKLGLLPIASINTGDLHSLGQFYQAGNPILFETVITIKKTKDIFIKEYNKSLDEMNLLISRQEAKSHVKSTAYSNFIVMDELSPYNIGQLLYFFEIAAATGAYLLGVNPFNQPGVNEYKKLVREELENV